MNDEKYAVFREFDNIKFIARIIEAEKCNKEFAEIILTDEKYKEFREPKNMGYIANIIETSRIVTRSKVTDNEGNTAEVETSHYIPLDKIEKIIFNQNIPMRYKSCMLGLSAQFENFDLNYDEILRKFLNCKEKILNNPDLYINGTTETQEQAQELVLKFFLTEELNILIASKVYDKETLDCLFRLRFEGAVEYLEMFKDFNAKDFELLNKIINSYTLDGKPFMPLNKIECIDLIAAYKKFHEETYIEDISSSIVDGKIDI